MRPLWWLLIVVIPESLQQNYTETAVDASIETFDSFASIDSVESIRSDQVDLRILNRKPYYRFPSRDQKDPSLFVRPPCFEVACAVDDSYPKDFVNMVVARHQPQIEQLYSLLYRHSAEKLILMENVTDSYRLKGNFACESDVAWMKVGWAHDVTGRNLLVINTPRFPQIHRLETCRYTGKRCEFLPPCYKSRCQQRFTHRHLIVIDPTQLSGGPFVDLFPLPSSCSCFVENFVYF